MASMEIRLVPHCIAFCRKRRFSLKRRALVGIIISLLCLLYILWNVDLRRLWEVLSHMQPRYLGVAVAGYALFLWARAVRWKILLAPIKNCPLGMVFSATILGYLANNIFPARLGELVRVYLIHRFSKASIAGSLATVALERLFDGLAVVVVLFITLFFLDSTAKVQGYGVEVLKASGFLLLGVVSLLLLGALALCWRPQFAVGCLSCLAARVSGALGDKVAKTLTLFAEGLAVLRQARHVLLVGFWSAVIWGIYLLLCTAFLPAFALPYRWLWGAMVFLGITLAAAVPAAPGLMGTFQVGVYWALVMVGGDPEKALAYALAFWGIQYLFILVAGLVEMWRYGLGFSQMAGMTASQESEADIRPTPQPPSSPA